MIRYMGIDPSLTATGIIVVDADGELVLADTLETKAKGIDRLLELRLKVHAILCANSPKLIAIEGYSFGSRGRATFSIAEWGGVLRTSLADKGIPFVDVPPTQVKRFATGKGNANKQQVAVAAYKRWGVELPDDNQTDAYVLAQIARAVDKPGELTKFQAEIVRTLGVAV